MTVTPIMTPRHADRFGDDDERDDNDNDNTLDDGSSDEELEAAVDAEDLDVEPAREGADIVRPSELGDGEHISTDLESGEDDEDDAESM